MAGSNAVSWVPESAYAADATGSGRSTSLLSQVPTAVSTQGPARNTVEDGKMTTGPALAFVFIAGLVTALATGLGALPFFLFGDISDRWNVALWGFASGIMLAASGFGLVSEGLAASTGFPALLVAGGVAGVVLVVVTDILLDRLDLPEESRAPANIEASEAPPDG